MPKVVMLGVDGFNPELVDRWIDDLPNLKRIQKEGIWGKIESIIPPSAPQAWISSQCGRNPGSYGFWDYAFRNDFTYEEKESVDSQIVDARVDCLYRILPKMGQKIAMINVPVTSPPPRVPGGYCISDSMKNSNFTWPDNLKIEIRSILGNYIFDIPNISEIDEDTALKCIYEMDIQRFALLKHFIVKKNCDYVFVVIPGTDLVSKIFLRYYDKKHRNYTQGNKYKDVIASYYRWIDKNVGEIINIFDSNTVLFIYSAYGSNRLDGRINLNEWLIQNGYLVINKYPKKLTSLKNCDIDWAKTKCWVLGSTGRLYINLKDREPLGIVELCEYDDLLDELTKKVKDIPDERGRVMNTQVHRRDDIHFGTFAKYGPDLFISFNCCYWYVSDQIGYGKGSLYSNSIDTGHSSYGYFCILGDSIPSKGEIEGVSVCSVAPTVIDIMGLPIVKNMEKPSILTLTEKKITSEVSKKKVISRLEALGY